MARKGGLVRPARVLALLALFVAAGCFAIALVLKGLPIVTLPDPGPLPGVSVERLRETVRVLCTDLAPRFYELPENLDRAADWIGGRMRDGPVEVGDHVYEIREGTFRNIVARRAGTDPARGAIVIGAHYDVYGPYPGADDNASGVAVLLELIRTLPTPAPKATQLFVSFSNEEPPFFGTDQMGSAHYARHLVDEGVKVDLMVALDTVGYYSDEPGSQDFPAPGLGLLFPNTGNFIGVIGDLGAGRWIRRVKRGMKAASSIPVESLRGPRAIPGIDWSDHLSFRRLGLPGVMVTDTAFLRNPNYHRETDTPETLDYERLAGLVRALHALLIVEDRD